MNKYVSSPEESELLPNLLNLSKRDDIDKSEFEGFLLAELSLTEELTNSTKFNVRYIKRIHKLSLGHLYSFAGKYRTVNMSKGGFLFIHPFREGNGRVARVLANLMARKQGIKGLNFEKIDEKVFPEYVSAVQMVADRNYEPMEKIIELIF